MSPSGTEKKGDLNELPSCAPEALKDLRTAAEGIIQEYYRLLGSGEPSKAPDPQQVFQDKGIPDPDQQATLLDNYDDYEEKVDRVKTDYDAEDDGVSVTTGEIGDAIKDAFDTMDRSVDDLNRNIDSAREDDVEERTNNDGTKTEYLPDHVIQRVFDGIWETLDKTYEAVRGVSDQAAERALNIGGGDEPPATIPTNYGSPPPSYPTASGQNEPTSGGVTPISGSMGTAIVSSGDKPTAFAMMEYLIKEHDFTPAQAAGIVANAKFESSFDVEAKGDYDENTGQYTAHGLFQWRFDRHQGLLDFANQPGEDLGDWRTHIDYMVQELNGGGYNEAASVVNNDNSSAATVAATFDSQYERSSGNTIGDRQSYATDLLTKWNEAGGNTTSRPSTNTGLMV